MFVEFFVEDDADKLVDVVNNHDLLLWSRMQLDMLPTSSAMPAGKMRWLLMAEKISDLAQAGGKLAKVTMDESLADVLDLMFHHSLVDILVVDEKRPHRQRFTP